VILSRFIIVSAVFLSLGSLTPAFAEDSKSSQDRDVLWFDQSFKIMTCDLKTTDSKCIGNPVSPLCVVETILATSIFRGNDGNDHQLRRIANGEIPGPAKNLKIWPPCDVRKGYRVVAVRQFLRKSLLPSSGHNMYGIKVGDVAITIETSPECQGQTCLPPDLSDNLSSILRKGPYGWYRIHGDNRYDFVDGDGLNWNCPGWPDGWTEPGPFPDYCPEPPQKN